MRADNFFWLAASRLDSFRVGRKHIRPVGPFLGGPSLRKSPQFALPNLAQENYAGIAPSEVLVHSVGNLALPSLSDLILNHDEVDAIGVNIIQMESAGEHFPHQVGAIGGFLRPFLPPSLEPFGGAVACKGNGSNFEMNVVFVVHG